MQVAVEMGGEVAGMELKYYAGKDVLDALLDCMERISKQDGAGVVEVVRCKDCGFWYVPKLEKGEKLGACGWWSGNAHIRATRTEDYCSRGIRKEGEG